jgi:hypothetical protein
MKILCDKTTGDIVEKFRDENNNFDDSIELDDINPNLCFAEVEDDETATNISQCTIILDMVGVYTVRVACRELGIEDKLDYMIQKEPNLVPDWSEANSISLESANIENMFMTYNLPMNDIKREIVRIYNNGGASGDINGINNQNDVCDYIIRVNSNLGTTLTRTEINDALNGKGGRPEFFIVDSSNHTFRIVYDYQEDEYYYIRYKKA